MEDWKQAQRDHWTEHRDQDENPLLWKEICELWEKTSNEGEESSKAIYHRVMGVRDAFARSVSPCGSCIHIMSQLILQCLAYARLEDIYVAGFVLYTGTEEMG
jgi:hypothetical protein